MSLCLGCKIVYDRHSIFKITHLHVHGDRVVSCFLKYRWCMTDSSGVKQQRIPSFRLFVSVEEIHLQHSCTVKCIPKRRTQCRGKLTAAGARSLSQQAVPPMDLPTSFLLLFSFSVLSKSLLHLSILVSDTDKFLEDSPDLNSFSSNTTWLAFKPTLSTTPQSGHDGSC